jgi:MFS family permease
VGTENGTGPDATPPVAGGTFAPFRYPAFRAIWIANLASNLGSMVQSVGAAWLMTDLTTSHSLIALVQASATVPIMLFGVFAGAIADNYDRRRVMLASQLLMLVTSAALAATTWAGLITPMMLLAFTITVGTGTALNSPAWQASVRQQVGMADLPQAIALNTISFNLARSVGPALGGLLISLWNVSLAFAVNAASFIAMIVVLWRWRPEVRALDRQPMLPAIAVGVRFCASSSPIRRVLVRGLALGFGVAGYQALVPAVVRDRLHGDEIDFGLMLGLFGIGSILAALAVGRGSGAGRGHAGIRDCPVGAGRGRYRVAGAAGNADRRGRLGRGADQHQRRHADAFARRDPGPMPFDLPGGHLWRHGDRIVDMGCAGRLARPALRAPRLGRVPGCLAHRAAHPGADAPARRRECDPRLTGWTHPAARVFYANPRAT